MTTLTADDGVRLDYTEHGDPSGRPVVLLAGFKAAGTSWLYQLGPLTKAGYRVVVVDVRGHGPSGRPESGVDMTRRAQDVHEVLEALDLTNAVLVGASMGGNTVWSYLDRFGPARVSAVVIVDQTPKMLNTPDWPHGFYGYDESNVDTYFASSIPDTGHGTPLWRRGMRLVRLLRVMGSGGERALTPGELVLLHDHATADWRPVIARTEVPVLFVAGAESELWPSSHARAAATLAPNGRSAVIRKDGHATNMEQPRAFNRGLLAFLAEVAPAREISTLGSSPNGGADVSTPDDQPSSPHIPAPDEATIPELEVDENIAPRPEEEVADVARAEPDTEDHAPGRGDGAQSA